MLPHISNTDDNKYIGEEVRSSAFKTTEPDRVTEFS